MIVRLSGDLGENGGAVSKKVRWLAIIAGFTTAVISLFMFGLESSISAAILILAALVQPYFGRPGRWLMWLGAFFLSITGILLGAAIPEGFQMLRLHPSSTVLALLSLTILSVLLLIWCDVALIADAIKHRGAPGTPEPRFSRAGDWPIWITAFCLTVWVFQASVRSLFSYRRTGHPDNLVLSLLLWSVIILFDTCLVVNAVKRRRAA
jgi:hypothetical protein